MQGTVRGRVPAHDPGHGHVHGQGQGRGLVQGMIDELSLGQDLVRILVPGPVVVMRNPALGFDRGLALALVHERDRDQEQDQVLEPKWLR